MESNKIFKKLDRMEELPTLPAIAMEVNKMLQDYETSIKDLALVIEKDQAMVPKILKLVNSSFFGFQSKISNLTRAIMLLGFNTVRNAVVSVSIIKAFSIKDGLEGFDITEFWTHSVGVATISRYLAEKIRCQFLEDAFTGGLLHDIGKIILVQSFPDLFKKVWMAAKENNLSFYEAEEKELSINHARIGGYLAKKWKLPQDLVDVIQYHHKVRKSIQNPDLLMVVHVADIIINSYADGSLTEIDLSVIYPDAREIMKSELETMTDWFPGVLEDINSACQFFLKE